MTVKHPLPPAVVVHGASDLELALRPGLPVTLISAPGAAGYAGCLWWAGLMRRAGDQPHLLDCAADSGRALEALRAGLRQLVLWPEAPGWAEVDAAAAGLGGWVLPARPPALDLRRRGAARRLHTWLRGDSGDAFV